MRYGLWLGAPVTALICLSVGCSGDDPSPANSASSGAASGSGGASGSSSSGGATSGGSTGSGGSSGATGSGGSAGSSSSGGSSGSGGSGSSADCLAGELAEKLGKDRLMIGASMSDQSAQAAPWDVRYLYLAGGTFDGEAPCDSCATSCTANGDACANSNPDGCAWWGCWQYDQDPPGAYVRDFVARAKADGQIPMITYYQILGTSGGDEGEAEVLAVNDVNVTRRYLADLRFVAQQVGQDVAILHIDPDFWGYAQQYNPDPHAIPAAVATANPTDCADQENSLAGLGRCMIAIARQYAPNAVVGLHGSPWGTNYDVFLNSDPSFDVAGEAAKLAEFLSECGPDADMIVVDAADRDAGYYTSIGQDRWWDDTNATLPNFTQAFAWANALAEAADKPLVWWQLPVGNMDLANDANHWHDNRVDYLMSHPNEIVAAHGAVIAFGAGDGEQTTPETDGGNLIGLVNAYADAGGQAICP